MTLERGLAVGAVTGMVGVVGLLVSLVHWNRHNFGNLDPRQSLRIVVPSAVALVMSFQIMFAPLFASVLGIRRVRSPPAGGRRRTPVAGTDRLALLTPRMRDAPDDPVVFSHTFVSPRAAPSASLSGVCE